MEILLRTPIPIFKDISLQIKTLFLQLLATNNIRNNMGLCGPNATDHSGTLNRDVCPLVAEHAKIDTVKQNVSVTIYFVQANLVFLIATLGIVWKSRKVLKSKSGVSTKALW